VFLFIFRFLVLSSYRVVGLRFISKMFKEIFLVRKFVISAMVILLGVIILNYLRFVYYGVGIRINYGFVFLYTVFLLIVVWFI